MSLFRTILMNLPEIKGPQQRRLSFKEKLKWTGIVLVLFFILGMVPLFGLGENALQQFEFLAIILASPFGSIISLGIGPIVTASIVLQLLNGSGILKLDLTTDEGKKNFQGLQKLMSIAFIIFEAIIYVFMGGLAPANSFAGTPIYFQLQLLLVFQLFLGGIMIMFMDEVITKWGFGSGISLFIAAGVSQSIFIRAFSPIPSPTNPEIMTGAVPALFQSLAAGDPTTAMLMIAGILATILVFVIAVYGQAMKIEIPLSFGMIRGHGIRWPLSFIYTSNIPVILVAALLANIQLWSRLLQNVAVKSASGLVNFISVYILGQVDTVNAGRGLIQWTNSPGGSGGLIGMIIKQHSLNIGMINYSHALGYLLVMILGAVLFSVLWVQTAGMDAKSQAKQIMASGLQIPGFRKDQRVLERLLNRYIWPLTIMGAILVGFLAAIADMGGALSRGTGILLAVMIVYRLYEEIGKQHMMDMHPMMRKMME